MLSIFKKILKTFRKSLIICLFSGVFLMIANKIMGVNIGVIYYLLLGGFCWILLSAGLILTNTKYIFSKQKRVQKKSIPVTKKKEVKTSQKSIQRKIKKREIS